MALTITAGTSTIGTSATATSITPTLPSGLASGDYTIVVVSIAATSGSITTPSGWTALFASAQSTASTSHSVAIFYRKWVSGDTAPAIAHTSGRSICTPLRVQGADAATFLETAVASTSQAAATTAIDAPSQTSTAGVVLMTVHSGRSAVNATAITFTQASMTELADVGATVASQTNPSHAIYTQAITAGVATGTRTATASSNATGSRGISFVIKEAVAGTNYTGSPSDPVGLTDSASAVLSVAYTANPSDPVGITDGGAPQSLTIVQSVPDAVGVTDSAVPVAASARTQGDPVGLTDSATAVVSFDRTQPDAVGITDNVSANLTAGGVAYTADLAESIGITDGDTPQAINAVQTVDDPVGLTDAATTSSASVRSSADSVGVSDSVSSALAANSTPADPVGITDSTTASVAAARTVADPEGITDAAQASLDATRSSADSVGVTDTAAAQLGANRGLADTAGITDAVTAVMSRVVTVADFLALTDSTSADFAGTGVQNLDDPTGIADATSAALSLPRTASDGVGLTDAATIALSRPVVVADGLGLTDGLATLAVLDRPRTDTLALTDTVLAELVSPTTEPVTVLSQTIRIPTAAGGTRIPRASGRAYPTPANGTPRTVTATGDAHALG